MKDLQRIVVPVDFLANTNVLVRYAVDMARKLSVKASFINVVDFHMKWAMVKSPHLPEIEKATLKGPNMKMFNLVEGVNESCPGCTGKVVLGEPVDEIIHFAKRQNADFIIIGSHGAKGLKNFLLGSVAKRVVKNAHCPVLVFNPFKEKKRMNLHKENNYSNMII